MKSLQKIEESELPVASTGQPNIGQMLQAVIDRGVNGENVAALEKLVDLYERVESKNAEKQFAAAFRDFQSELPVVVAESAIPNRGKYQKYEDLIQKDGIGALLSKHGFTVSYSQDFRENRCFVTCYLAHTSGHTKPTTYGVRVSEKADSTTQADQKASTTAKRNAFCQALNITIRQDCLMDEEQDASLLGDPNAFVTTAQADEIEDRAKMVLADIPALLKFAGASSFKTIPANKYNEIDSILSRKEKSSR